MDQRQNDNNIHDNHNYLQYNQGFNANDTLFPHTNDSSHSDAGWSVNASSYPQQNLSRAAYSTQDWSTQHPDHLSARGYHNSNDAYRGSPLSNGNNIYSATSAFNTYTTPPAYNYSQPQYDPTLVSSATQAFKQLQPAYPIEGTIEPQALEHESRYTTQQQLNNVVSRATGLVDQRALTNAIPVGKQAGRFSIIDFDTLVQQTKSESLAAFATMAKDPIEWDINRAALPMYIPRQSKNALKRLAGDDGAILAKINSKRIKKQRVIRSGMPKPMKSAGDVVEAIRKQMDDSSDESHSEYTSESDVEETPLPAGRPETPKEAIEYDTIKALWRSKRKVVDADEVRKGLVDFWEVIRTVRDRWKADTAALLQAEEKKLKGELPTLRQRVKEQRDMIEFAFKTALKHAHRTIIETLSENTSLLFVCYQFLLDRQKAEDVNGSLARTILEVMTLFNTISTEKMEKVYLNKVLPRYVKTGDAKTQYYAKTIMNKASAYKDPKAPTTKPVGAVQSNTASGVKRSVDSTVKKPAALVKASNGVAPKKRQLEDAVKPTAKKIATSNGTVTKPGEVKPKPAVSKLTSGLYAGLTSATKKPGTSVKANTAAPINKENAVKPSAAPVKSVFSFAETMKTLTQPKEEKPAAKPAEKETTSESAEQKARRLRREARGPLRVHWKSNEELVAVREFVHDPEEEMGHDASQTRDVADLKGEGRMFKQQHNKMDLDEDDDEPAVEIVVKMVDWNEPSLIDFSDVPKDEQDRQYFPYGGGKLQPESLENAERKKYEDSTLLVFYSHSDDVPATPREPENAITGEEQKVTAFGAPGQETLNRAQKAQNLREQRQNRSKPIDFSAIRSALQPPSAQPTIDIGSILAQIQAAAAPTAPLPYMPPPQMPPAGVPNPLAAFFPPPPPVQQSAQPDLQSIIAQAMGNVQAPPVPIPPPPPMLPGMPPMDPGFLKYVAEFQAKQAQQAQIPAQSALYEDPERRRWREQDAVANGDIPLSKDNPNYKTKPCKYWQEGKCTKGDNCTYKHG